MAPTLARPGCTVADWSRAFDETIPLPEEMAANAAQGYYHDFLSPLDLPELELDASDSGRGRILA